MTDNLPVTTEEEAEAFNEIFYANHGVGDTPMDKELAKIGNGLDPNLPTLQECNFAKMVMNGSSPKAAYIESFGFTGKEYHPVTYTRNAKKLLERPRVARFMYELQSKAAALLQEDMANIVNELNEDRKLARDLGQPSAAIAATKTKAQILGLMEEKRVTNNISVNLSDDQKKLLLSRVGEVIDAEYEVIENKGK